MRRFFSFLLAFCILIGGTLASVQAASVEAVSLDDGISVASVDVDGTEYTSFSAIAFSTSTSWSSVISSINYIDTNTLITVPAGTQYIWFDVILSNVGFAGFYNYSISSISWAGYEIDGIYFQLKNSSSVVLYSIPSSDGNFNERTYYGTIEFNASGVNEFFVRVKLNNALSSSVSMYSPSLTVISGSDDLDLTETNSLISTSNGLLSNIWDSITTLPQQIIDLFISAMQSLFIPSDGYFDSKFSDLYDLFDTKLGFLMYPSEVLETFLSALQTTSSDGFVIDFPAFSLDVGGTSYQIWDDYTFYMDDIKSYFPEIFSAAEVIFTVILCGYSINLIITYYDVVIWGSSSTALVAGDRDDDY